MVERGDVNGCAEFRGVSGEALEITDDASHGILTVVPGALAVGGVGTHRPGLVAGDDDIEWDIGVWGAVIGADLEGSEIGVDAVHGEGGATGETADAPGVSAVHAKWVRVRVRVRIRCGRHDNVRMYGINR